MRRRRAAPFVWLAVAAAVAPSAACDRQQTVPTSEEMRDLDEADALLDEAPERLANVDDNPQNGAGAPQNQSGR